MQEFFDMCRIYTIQQKVKGVIPMDSEPFHLMGISLADRSRAAVSFFLLPTARI